MEKTITEIVTVTPDLAQRFLTANKTNRAINQDRVTSYANDMRAGKWRLNNQGIGFGQDGVLYDGQHRLHAVIQAGVAVDMLLVMGLPTEARTTVDKNRPRSIADDLRMHYGETNAPHLVSSAKMLYAILNRREGFLSFDTTRDLIKEYREGLDFALLATKDGGKIFNKAPINGALALAYKANPERVREFANRFVSGLGLLEDSPIALARNYFIRIHSGLRNASTRRDASVKLLRCVQAFLQGEVLLRTNANEESVEFFAQAWQ